MFLNSLILGNSLVTLLLIFNQNESTKDSSKQNTSSSSNPLELPTWICFLFQLILYLFQTKFIDF